MVLKQAFVTLVFCLLITSCQNMESNHGNEYDHAINEALASYEPSNSERPPQLSDAIENELFQEQSLDKLNIKATEATRLNIATKNVPIREFLPSLIEGLDVSLVMHPKFLAKFLLKASFSERSS